MHGEFIGVWSETWREVWLPLIDREDVPEDIFCELYRELAPALKEPSSDRAIALVVNDSIQLREVFDRALVLGGIDIDLERREAVFSGALTESIKTTTQRREALTHALAAIVPDPVKGDEALEQALSAIANDPGKRAEALERAREIIVNDKVGSREAFERTQAADLGGERALVRFLESAHGVLDDVGGDSLANVYFNLLAGFIDKFSLRYDLRRPCTLCPTLPGVFASLVRDLRALTSKDGHLDGLMKEFEDAVRDLRTDRSDGRIKTCIQKQVNLLEAIGRMCPGVTSTTLGAICNQVGTWPHEKIKEAMKEQLREQGQGTPPRAIGRHARHWHRYPRSRQLGVLQVGAIED